MPVENSRFYLEEGLEEEECDIENSLDLVYRDSLEVSPDVILVSLQEYDP